MISIVVYGRNDSYGYNLHKRAALGINCMAEILSDPADEILFVDYNTPDDHPTFPEAIADTLTGKAVERLRVLRVRPAVHERFSARTHLKALEPVARNVAVRRSSPANRWILSTNTDMIFVPRGAATLSEIAADLAPGFYHLPRFELPESLWESFDRKDPASVIDQVRTYGRTMFLNEIVYGAECIKYDGPGDFQLILRDDLFRFDGFNEDMLLGWHVDSNIAKRLFLVYRTVGDVVDRLFGYHCDHTRQVTPMHQHRAAANDAGAFIERVTDAHLPQQAQSWGCVGDQIEEIRLTRTSSHVYLDGLRATVRGEWAEPATARYTYDSYGQSSYDTRHVLPFLADLFASAPRDWTVGWIGGRADTFRLFCGVWERLGFRGGVVIDDWSVPLLGPGLPAGVRSAELPLAHAAADVFVFDFGAPSECPNPLLSRGVERGRLDAAVDRLARRSFLDLVEQERARIAAGAAPRRFVGINAVHNRYESLIRDEIGAASTPFATRIRHGFVTPQRSGAAALPPEDEDPGRPARPHGLAQRADVLERMPVREGGRRAGGQVVAPFGRRGYVVRGFPYERLLPGTYQVEFSIASRSPMTFGAFVRPIIIEVVGPTGYLARERVTFLMNATVRIAFSVPPHPPEGLAGVEVRVFRGRFVDFVITGLRLWELPSIAVPPQKPAATLPDNALLRALGLPHDAVGVMPGQR
jgi:hypothetical protein